VNRLGAQLTQGAAAALIIFLMGYVFLWCVDPVHFPISAVKWQGERKYLSQTALRQVVLPALKVGFFRLNVSRLQQQLLSLPWTKQVDVRKVWPGQLVIRIEEHVPAAWWGEKGILSTMGVLFYPDLTDVRFPDLPVLEGPQGKASFVWQHYRAMKEMLATLDDASMKQLSLAPRGAWHLQLSNGLRIILGTEDVIVRLKQFIHVYLKRRLPKRIAYVDLRYTNGMVVSYKNE